MLHEAKLNENIVSSKIMIECIILGDLQRDTIQACQRICH